MADVVSALRTYLLGQSSVSSIIGQRLYLDVLPQNATLPAATISKISGTVEHTLSARTAFTRSRFQLTQFSSTREEANRLSAMIYQSGIAALKGVTNSVDIRGVMVETGQRMHTVQPRDGSDEHLYATDIDLMVTYLET